MLFTSISCLFFPLNLSSGVVRPAELISHFSLARFSDQRLSSAENRNPCANHAALSGCTWVQPSPCWRRQRDLITWLSLICPTFLWMQVKSRVDLSLAAVHLWWEIWVKWKTERHIYSFIAEFPMSDMNKRFFILFYSSLFYSSYVATKSLSKFSQLVQFLISSTRVPAAARPEWDENCKLNVFLSSQRSLKSNLPLHLAVMR